LHNANKHYDFIHFHDYKGLGFFCTSAKLQGIAFDSTTLVVQLHGPTRWTKRVNRVLFSHRDELLIDFMERESIRQADQVISPSVYLIQWLSTNGFQLPSPTSTHVIKNAFRQSMRRNTTQQQPDESTRITLDQVIFFGRHEFRKGLTIFCDALELISDVLVQRGVCVCFVGKLGEINGQHSGIYLSERTKNWRFPVEFRIGLDRAAAIAFLRSQAASLVVIPSPEENSPFTVVEAIAAGNPVLTSAAGGARELIDAAFHDDAIVEMEPEKLAARLALLLADGAKVPQFAESIETVEYKWLAFHEKCRPAPANAAAAQHPKPKVVVGITHFERPRHVIGAVMSVLRQTFDNIELVVVDDGSRSADVKEVLPDVIRFVERVGARWIHRQNGYLGAARNTVFKETTSEYLIFLDDDDLMLPDAIERLVSVAVRTGADIVTCFNYFLDASQRTQYEVTPERFAGKVSYVPTGGPLSLAPFVNHFGTATALIKRSFFEKIGGYSELKQVGYEDYELYVRALQAGAHIQIVPLPLYLYEVGKPSMLSTTSRVANTARVMEVIDVTRNIEQWRDSLEVVAGAEASEVQRHSSARKVSDSPHGDVIKQVIDAPDAPARTTALGAYANLIGAPHIAAAWASALEQPDNQSASLDRSVRTFRRTGAVVPPSTAAANEIKLAAELAGLIRIGRYDDAARELMSAIAFSGELSETMIEFSYLIGSGGVRAPEVAKELMARLMAAYVDEEREVEAHGAVGWLAFSAGIFDQADASVGQIEALESDAYVRSYSDLAAEFAQGNVHRALDHFRDYGFAEGRTGFPVLARVGEHIGERLKRNIRPWRVREEVRLVKEGGISAPEGAGGTDRAPALPPNEADTWTMQR
jgi:glycosyltransferase involved in cell wall biosynthesis/GT2 family glycosyltransferase